MHNGQKNLLVVGLEDPEVYSVIARLLGRSSRYRATSILLALIPTGICIVGIILFRLRHRVHHRIGLAVVTQQRRYRFPGLILIIAGAIAFAYHYPFRVVEYDPYRDAGLAPHQALIDRVRELGGMTFWSMPEARDAGTHDTGYGTITIRTDPYPGDLLATRNYTGFGAIYEDNITFINAGNGWDRLLTQYCRGLRSTPAWGIGEAAYHEESYQHIGNVRTVFLVREKTQAEVEQALRSGRYYAMFRQTDAPPLHLEDFYITPSEDTTQAAGMGEELVTPDPPMIHVKIGGVPQQERLHVELIRSGERLYRAQDTSPFTLHYRDLSPIEKGSRTYYRLTLSSPSVSMVSNPIFVRSE
jgi:hypothetical protein